MSVRVAANGRWQATGRQVDKVRAPIFLLSLLGRERGACMEGSSRKDGHANASTRHMEAPSGRTWRPTQTHAEARPSVPAAAAAAPWAWASAARTPLDELDLHGEEDEEEDDKGRHAKDEEDLCPISHTVSERVLSVPR